jgi:radical SAM protein with 4Fe4S-binding SPASM domain
MVDRDFKFNYFEQYNPSVAKEFLEKQIHYKQLAHELDIKIEVGSMEFGVEEIYYARKLINTTTSKFLNVNLFPLGKRKGMCVAPWLGRLVIKQDGTVNLCSQTNCVLGNINYSSLEEIWNCEKIKRIRESFKEGVFPKVCGYCHGMTFDDYPRNSFIYESKPAQGTN